MNYDSSTFLRQSIFHFLVPMLQRRNAYHNSEKPEHVLSQALKQIEKKRYAAELEEAGIKKALKIAIAFRGKELWVKEG